MATKKKLKAKRASAKPCRHEYEIHPEKGDIEVFVNRDNAQKRVREMLESPKVWGEVTVYVYRTVADARAFAGRRAT